MKYDRGQPDLILPFKPFTLEEAAEVTGADAKFIDLVVGEGEDVESGRKILRLLVGSGVIGLEYMALFSLFVGRVWRDEGAPADRVEGVMRFLASRTLEDIGDEVSQGNSFPALVGPPRAGRAVMVPAPTSRLGQRLNLGRLHDEFRQRLKATFKHVDDGREGA